MKNIIWYSFNPKPPLETTSGSLCNFPDRQFCKVMPLQWWGETRFMAVCWWGDFKLVILNPQEPSKWFWKPCVSFLCWIWPVSFQLHIYHRAYQVKWEVTIIKTLIMEAIKDETRRLKIIGFAMYEWKVDDCSQNVLLTSMIMMTMITMTISCTVTTKSWWWVWFGWVVGSHTHYLLTSNSFLGWVLTKALNKWQLFSTNNNDLIKYVAFYWIEPFFLNNKDILKIYLIFNLI